MLDDVVSSLFDIWQLGWEGSKTDAHLHSSSIINDGVSSAGPLPFSTTGVVPVGVNQVGVALPQVIVTKNDASYFTQRHHLAPAVTNSRDAQS